MHPEHVLCKMSVVEYSYWILYCENILYTTLGVHIWILMNLHAVVRPEYDKTKKKTQLNSRFKFILIAFLAN
jgi:archaellum biogenesis protein FlaJ (TadC family)